MLVRGGEIGKLMSILLGPESGCDILRGSRLNGIHIT